MYVAYYLRSQEEFNELLTSFDIGYTLGRAALGLLVVLLAISLYSKLKYEYKQLAHKLLGLVLILGIMHSATVIERGVPESPLAAVYSLLFFSVSFTALISYLMRNVLRGIFVPKAPYRIKSVEKIAKGIWQMQLRAVGDKQIKAKPGQFVYINIHKRGLKGKLHPFSLSEIKDNEIHISIKEIGDFTGKISDKLEGEKVSVEGAFGNFSSENGSDKQVWIAGGIGITPFVSMADALSDQKQVKLYYSATSKEEMAYQQQLEKLASQNTNFSVEFVITNEQERLTAAQIVANIDEEDYEDTTFFICGPGDMNKQLAKGLYANGVSRENVFIEHFRMLDK
jgi:predicted ferric reductase